MRWWTVLLLVSLTVTLGGCLFGASGDVDSARAHELVGQGATLVDVRSPEEFTEGHIQGAVNVPVGELGGKLASIPKDKPVVVYCHSGMRSKRAASALKDAGYTQVYDLGAMSRWKD
ncbi:MAG: rhodanese-like domain-containing protein [Polyangiaceae bacterium]|nr:rhodanese-like domain-containing protein [Polyangiaceae bacterium]